MEGLFESWCLAHAVDPVSCPIGPLLEFLQEKLVAGAAANTLRVYVAAIATLRELDEIPLGDIGQSLHLCMVSGVWDQYVPLELLLGTYQLSLRV